MKCPLVRFLFAFVTAFFCTASAVHAQDGGDNSPKIQTDRPLHVLVDNATGELTIDQFSYLGRAVRKAFEAHGYTGKINLERWGAGMDEGEQSIRLRIVRWGESVPGQIECRLYVVAQSNGSEKDFGVVVGKKSGIANSSSRLIELYREAAVNAADNLIEKLVDRNWLAASEDLEQNSENGGS